VIRSLARFVALPVAEQGRIFEAIACLLIVRIILGQLPFPWALKVLRVSQGVAATGRVSASEAREVGLAIARAARHVSFRAMCLEQAFAALLMLRRRELAATVHLGLAREPISRDLAAHAWSRCGDFSVTGAAVARRFTSVVALA
jgi:hypothetical protein